MPTISPALTEKDTSHCRPGRFRTASFTVTVEIFHPQQGGFSGFGFGVLSTRSRTLPAYHQFGQLLPLTVISLVWTCPQPSRHGA